MSDSPTLFYTENLQHILTVCSAYTDIRTRIIHEYEELCAHAKTTIFWSEIIGDNRTFCQFVLDPASFNLTQRIHRNDPILEPLFEVSRDYCFAVNKTEDFLEAFKIKTIQTRPSSGLGSCDN